MILTRGRKKSLKNLVRFLITIFVIGILVKSIMNFMFTIHSSKPSASQPVKSTTTTLKGAVSKALEGTKGTYGIVITNLKTHESYSFSEHQTFETGSLYKLWVMAEVYKQIEQGKLNHDDVLSEDVSVLNSKFNIDSEDAELTDGTITLTVDQAVNQMITISHNYAALLLTEKIGLSSLASFLNEYQFTESKVETNGDLPTTTAYDIAKFYQDLYQGKLANPEDTKMMLDTLKAQQLNNKLPKYLPKGVSIAHKTGELDDYSHDAGIVYTPRGDYIIVVLSQSDMPDAAADRIAQISKAVYDYFLKGGDKD